MLRQFRHRHLAPLEAEETEPFFELARRIVLRHRRTPERTVALRKLLEARDAAVRSARED